MDQPLAAAPDAVVRVTRTFNAPPQLVFRAWVDPEMITQWFARDPGTPPGRVIQVDPRPGGRYVVDVTGPEDGRTYRMQGTYREVRPPTRLAFTWWYEGADFAESVVTIDLRESDGGSTELTLTHALLPERQREPHRQGWQGCFDMLAKALGTGSEIPAG